MINKLLWVLLFLLVIPNYSQDLIVKNYQQSIMVKPNLNKQFPYFEKNDFSDNTQKTNGLNNGNLIWITDVGINCRINHIPQRIISFPDYGDINIENERRRFYLTSDVGALKKINKNIGFGISHFIALDLIGDAGGVRNGIKLIYRQWLNNGSHFDISPGITLFDSAFKSPGFTGSIDWWKSEYYALTMLIEYLPQLTDLVEDGYDEDGRKYIWRTKEYEKDFGIYFGLKTGSKAGLIGNGIYYGIILIVAAGALMMSGSG
jgi:hypothetical protein